MMMTMRLSLLVIVVVVVGGGILVNGMTPNIIEAEIKVMI
jgi:hypothetical protein